MPCDSTSPSRSRVRSRRAGLSIERLPDHRTADMEYEYIDTPAGLAQELLRHQREQSATPFEAPWPLASWPAVPTRVLLSRGDRFLPLEFMRRVTRDRLRLEPDVMPGDHCPMLGRQLGHGLHQQLLTAMLRHRILRSIRRTRVPVEIWERDSPSPVRVSYALKCGFSWPSIRIS